MKVDFQNSIAVTLATAGLAAFTFGCSRPPSEQTQIPPEAAKVMRLSGVRDYGSGVYVFPAREFPTTLSDFREKYPERKIISVTQGEDRVQNPGWNSAYACSGSFVVVTEMEK